MQILVLSDRPFNPKLGDGLRFSGLLRPLVGRHRFDLICFANEGETLDASIRSLFNKVTLVPSPPIRRSPLIKRAVKAVSSRDFVRTSVEMRRAIAQAVRSHDYEVVLDAGGYSCPNLPTEPLTVPLVLDSVDEPIVRELRALKHAPLTEKFAHIHRAWRHWLFERGAFSRAHLNIYVSEVDAGLYGRLFPGRGVAVVANGVDVEYFAPTTTRPSPAFVVFEGNMNFPPNVDTAKRLVNEILPLLKIRVPNVTVGLIGRDPSEEVRRLSSEFVEVTGTVDDVRPYLARAAVFACPMRLGSGIKNKILQAWAMARPVVATSESLGGLSAVDGENIIVRDKPQEFSDAVADLIQNPKRAAELGAAGRLTVEREFSWERQSEKLERCLLDAAKEFAAKERSSDST